ncbi:MAG TPA: hypothetical protein VNW90_19145 [Acetobacteraceae bacterium]|jgi:hypothetical protein|nr:hypothetical protein [Acetobacteraceae bacterium]
MTNEHLKPTHVVESWQHVFADGVQRSLRLYVAKDDDGWQLMAARIEDGPRLGLLTRAQMDDLIESFDQNAASGYPFDDEVQPMTGADRKELN